MTKSRKFADLSRDVMANPERAQRVAAMDAAASSVTCNGGLVLRIQWFGEPWPSAERRAPICADDSNKIATPVNTTCLECKNPIEEKHRGVVTGCSPGIWGHWILDRDGARVPVCSYHLVCWLKEVVGGELSAKILARMEYRSFDDPGVKKITEAQDVQPGRGWRERS